MFLWRSVLNYTYKVNFEYRLKIWYRLISKNCFYWEIRFNYNVKIRLNYNVSIEQNSGIDRYRTKPGIEPALICGAGRNQTILRLAVKLHHKHGSSELIKTLNEHGTKRTYGEVLRFRKSVAKFVLDTIQITTRNSA